MRGNESERTVCFELCFCFCVLFELFLSALMMDTYPKETEYNGLGFL